MGKASRWPISSRASQPRVLTSSVSIAHIEKTSWTPICSIRFRRCVTSPSYGSKNTTGFAHMKLWKEFHRINSVLTSHESVYFRLVLKMGSLQAASLGTALASPDSQSRAIDCFSRSPRGRLQREISWPKIQMHRYSLLKILIKGFL